MIDIGTNSVRLMFANLEKGEIKCEYKTLRTTRIGQGVNDTGVLNREAMMRSIGALKEYKDMANRRDPQMPIFCFATSAVRDAKNKFEFVDMVKDQCGFEVEVLPGEYEAQCGFVGVIGDQTGGIIDIGGGSTEVMFGHDGSIDYLKSFNIGTVRMLEIFGEKKASDVRNWVAERFKAIHFEGMRQMPCYAIGGTATSLAAIDLRLQSYDPEKIQGHILQHRHLTDMLDMLLDMSVEQRKQIVGMEPKRADVITFGASILCAFLDATELDSVTVSERDNMEGYLAKKFALTY